MPTARPVIYSTRGAVAAGHYLATGIGLDVLKSGGNAIDAAVATGLALHLLEPHQNGVGGEVPVLIYSAKEKRVWALSGQGCSPKAATVERFRSMGIDLIPGDGYLPACVPAPVATWVAALERFGTKSFAELASPAIEIARSGWAMTESLGRAVESLAGRFVEEWPSSAEIYAPNGRPIRPGEIVRNPEWSDTFRMLADAEKSGGLKGVFDCFYRGPVAERMVRFAKETPILDASGEAHAGLLELEDFAGFEARWEEPARTNYRGIDVFKCGTWTQGPVLLQSLNLLEGFDLRSMGPNSADYLHTVLEAMKLAFADREFYYGDPLHVSPPMDRLLSKEYAKQRSELIDAQRATLELRAGGYDPIIAKSVMDVVQCFSDEPLRRDTSSAGAERSGPRDTTKVDVIDSEGNMVSATPSGGWIPSSPVVPGVGFPLGTRGQMFVINGRHPNGLAPGKRPRATLTPTLATKNDRPFLSFGSPGGDGQDQWALQFFLNVVEFGMNLQEAVEQATVTSEHWPGSFYPREASPGKVAVEAPIGKKVMDDLAARGHEVVEAAVFSCGRTHAVSRDDEAGVLSAAVSPRDSTYQALGW